MTEEEQLDERYKLAGKRAIAALSFSAQHTGIGEPLHLLMGITSTMAQEQGLAELLMKKGVIPKLEYKRAVVEAYENEIETVRQELSKLLGREIILA